MGALESAMGTESTDNIASGANEPGIGETITVQTRPEWVPEKFFKEGVINFKEMAKSFSELETKQGKQGQQTTEETPAPVKTPAPVVETPTITVPGVDAPSVVKFTEELKTAGKLSDASYEALAKLGYSKVVVDSYVKGMTADATVEAAVSEARIADKQIGEIVTSIGGQKVLDDMLQWANANVDAKDLEAYNKAVSSSDPSQVKLAVQGMLHSYTAAQPPELLQGNRTPGTPGVEPFASNDEVVEAMSNPRYDRDQAYRDMVAKRISVSNVFGQSRDVTPNAWKE